MADLPYIRAVYVAPWRKGSLAKPGMVRCRVDIAVRPATTFADKAMLCPQTDLTTFGAAFRSIGWIGEDRRDAGLCRFIGGEVLQLPEGPAVKPCPNPQTALDAITDVGEVFHRDGLRTDAFCFGDDFLAHNVVDVTDAPGLLARDFTQELLGALGAVGLKAAAQGKMPVTLMPEFPASPEFARAGGREVVFANVKPEDWAGLAEFYLLFEDEVEIPLSVAAMEFGFFRFPPRKKAVLVLARPQRHGDALAQRIERKAIPSQREGAAVEMHCGTAEIDRRYRLALFDLPVGLERFIGRRYAPEHIAAHLGAKRRLRPQAPVNQRMEPVAVPASCFLDRRNQEIASGGIGFLKIGESGKRSLVSLDLNRGRPHRDRLFLLLGHLPPLLHVFGTLDIFTDRLRTHITRRADIVGRGPKVAAPQPLLQLREPDEQLARRGSLQNLDRIGHRLRRRNGHKQVDVIGLDFLGQHWPPLFLANRVDHLRQRRRHIPGQNIMPILRTPHHMVSRLENAIAVMQHFWHNHMVQENCAARNLAFLPRLKPGVSSEVIL